MFVKMGDRKNVIRNFSALFHTRRKRRLGKFKTSQWTNPRNVIVEARNCL